MTEYHVIMLAGIGVLGVICQWIAWRLNLPAILFLLLGGLLLGPATGVLDPEALFGDLLFPFISLSVAIILFEGSLTLEFQQIRGLEKVVRRMVSTGMLITWLVTTAATHWIMGFPWELALLFGAIMVVTGPTVIAPLLRTVRPVPSVANTLRWEGIIIDPIGALLAVLAYEFIVSLQGSVGWGHALLIFGQTVITGTLIGVVIGAVIGEILRRNWLPDYLESLSVLAAVIGAFAISNGVSNDSGLLTVTVMGIWIANKRGVPVKEILEFKETLSLILLSVLFIILAARVKLESLLGLGWQGFAVLAIMLFIARPLKVLYSSRGSPLNWREKALLAWIAPRGIVAAAVSALFALRLADSGLAHVDQLLPLSFLVIIGTVILQSATARPVAVALKVAEPEPVGFLIVGANPLARAIGLALHEHKVPIRLCDSDWDSIARARMDGLPTYYGSPISEHARLNLDRSGLGRVLALTAGDSFNELVTMRFRDEFGKNRVYTLPDARRQDAAEKHQISLRPEKQVLFAPDATYWELSSLLGRGGAVRSTVLTNAFNIDSYRAIHGEKSIPLFAINPDGMAQPFTLAPEFKPTTDWTIVSLVPDNDRLKRNAARHRRDKTAELDSR